MNRRHGFKRILRINADYFIYFTFILLFVSCIRGVPVSIEEPEPVIDPLRLIAAEIALSMDDHLLAAQLLISGIDGNENLPHYTVNALTEIPAGGVMLFRYNLNAGNDNSRKLLTQVSSLITNESGIPPFIAVDHEGGTVNRFQRGVATLPAASFYWELFQSSESDAVLEKIEVDSYRAGREINELGINMNFAPVAEYLIKENRVFLERRSYGPDPYFTAHSAAAFIRGMERAGVICVVKHFPGSAGPDPHYAASVLDMEKDEINKLVYPFSFAINNGARAIMAAHTVVPVIDSKIASLSPIIMQNWLRGELGFDGIILSDDFIMTAAGDLSPEEAAVLSIAAGSDMILVWPAHLKKTHEAILAALEDGRLSHERLQDAAQRVIYEKLRMGLLVHYSIESIE